jgi:asparagine synthase (glutamine-hydrolysing)
LSGIVGIINTDGAPVDRGLLRRMTDFMARRGPDAQEVWSDGSVGFGHTMLRTTWESEGEVQPRSLGGELWVTADARIDGRAALVKKLERAGYDGLKDAPDADLILRAYAAWGEDCVKHLIGDFSFAVWDAPRRRLFCARDHFGVKSFYYAQPGQSLVLGNSLNCLRLHPGTSGRLDDLAIADFLVFGANQEPGTTAFADVRRLPPAHSLTWEDDALRLRRYWAPPIDGQIRYRRAGDYVERFDEELETAVADRLRTSNVGVFMSGGMDSPAMAAVAKKALSRNASSFDLRAYVTVYDHLIADEERYYSGLVAESLNIPVRYLAADDYALYERWDQPELNTPEPNDDPQFAALNHDLVRETASNCRVALTGFGGDPALLASPSYVPSMLRSLRLIDVASGALIYALTCRAFPPIGVRTLIRRCLKGKPERWRPDYPEWINRNLELRLGLRERWEELTRAEPRLDHPLRPEAHEQFASPSPYWANLFESMDPGVTHSPLEVRHPFFDVRLVKFLLALPPFPWFLNKALLRVAMRNVLPEEVRVRPKAPLAGNPLEINLGRAEKGLYDGFEPTPKLAEYVDINRLPASTRRSEPGRAWPLTRPYSLNYWLRQQGA